MSTHHCEIEGCINGADTDVPYHKPNGDPTVLVVCNSCAKAFEMGREYARDIRERTKVE